MRDKNRIEFVRGNWNIICLNEEHKTYLAAAYTLKELRAATRSWHGAWLSSEMKSQYLASVVSAEKECERLWELIPGKDDLLKNH